MVENRFLRTANTWIRCDDNPTDLGGSRITRPIAVSRQVTKAIDMCGTERCPVPSCNEQAFHAVTWSGTDANAAVAALELLDVT